MENATGNSGGSQTSGSASGLAQMDAETARLVERYAAGEKLNASEFGKIGGWMSKTGAKKPGRPKKLESQPVVSSAEAPAQSVDNQSDLSILVRDTTASILESCDDVACESVESIALEVGANKETIERIKSRARMKSGIRAGLINTSPSVVQSLEMNPAQFPIATAATLALAHLASLFLVFRELRQMRKEKAQCSTSQPKQAQP